MVTYKKSQVDQCRWIRCFRLGRLPPPEQVFSWGYVGRAVPLLMGGDKFPIYEFDNSIEAILYALEVQFGSEQDAVPWDAAVYYDAKEKFVFGDILLPHKVATTAQWAAPFLRPMKGDKEDDTLVQVGIPPMMVRAIHDNADLER